tara:strand:- start:7752 stop:9251 length:1500 start_codon:yes stop_codon:yes gene_type:complete
MAKPLQPIVIQAPAFYGLNTQDSPTALTEQFALTANNCVIDRFGRIGARKGWALVSPATPLSVVTLSEYVKNDGTSETISSTSDEIYAGTETITSIKPTGYVMTDGDFSYATVSGVHYLFNEGEPPLYYDGTTCDLITNKTGAAGTPPRAGIAISGFGRMWVARTDTELQTIYWSDLLNGAGWSGGSSGAINVSTAWASGGDEITGLGIHNNFLFIFGKRQVLIYQGAEEPSTMSVVDTIVGIGCLDHDTIQNTGSDLLFLSETGVRSINRTIQEKSAPIGDISKNVRNELTGYLSGAFKYKSAYSPKEAFYLISIVGSGITYCFDMRGPMQDGSHRATVWDSINPLCLLYRSTETDLLLGKEGGIAQYTGYKDDTETYQMSYFSNFIDFGAPSNLKMLKNLKITFIGGSNTDVTLNYGYDYSFAYKKRAFTLPEQNVAEFNGAEFNVGEFNQGILVNRPAINASSSGQVVQLGVEITINGSPISVQRITAQAILGRVI